MVARRNGWGMRPPEWRFPGNDAAELTLPIAPALRIVELRERGRVMPQHAMALYQVSRIDFSRARSFLFARRIAMDMNGDTTRENPDGFPRLRNDIRVLPSPAADH